MVVSSQGNKKKEQYLPVKTCIPVLTSVQDGQIRFQEISGQISQTTELTDGRFYCKAFLCTAFFLCCFYQLTGTRPTKQDWRHPLAHNR